MKKALIFDLDGTLWDVTHEVMYLINKEFSDVTGKEVTLEDVRGFMGLTLDEIFAKVLPEQTPEELKDSIRRYVKEEVNHLNGTGGILYPNLESTLVKLKENFELYIVSNCGIGYIESFLNYHKMAYLFSDFENAERTRKSKGENIQIVMERNNIDKAYYIGDTNGDKVAAYIAGVPFIYAKYGFGNVEGYDYVIEKFDDLIELSKML